MWLYLSLCHAPQWQALSSVTFLSHIFTQKNTNHRPQRWNNAGPVSCFVRYRYLWLLGRHVVITSSSRSLHTHTPVPLQHLTICYKSCTWRWRMHIWSSDINRYYNRWIRWVHVSLNGSIPIKSGEVFPKQLTQTLHMWLVELEVAISTNHELKI